MSDIRPSFGRQYRRPSTKDVDERVAGPYDLGEKIGEGHGTVVRVARHVFTQELVAVKMIDKSVLTLPTIDNLTYEVLCMKLVQHPYVVRLFEVLDTPRHLYLVEEYADGGDLHAYLSRHDVRGRLDESRARRYFSHIVQAIAYCHQLHIVHRDLKPQNIVFFKTLDIVKVADFGLSKNYEPGGHLRTPCGSLAFSAPEMFLGGQYEPPAIDIWGLGVILYMLVSGKSPFQEMNDSETITRILDANYRRLPSRVSPQCSHLISRMLQKLPSERATLSEVLNHAWLIPVTSLTAARSSQAQFTSQSLVAGESLTAEDHKSIISTMSAAGIGTEEELERSLKENAYDQTSASYYLLAERLLRSKLRLKRLADSSAPSAAPAESFSNESLASNSSHRGRHAGKPFEAIQEEDIPSSVHCLRVSGEMIPVPVCTLHRVLKSTSTDNLVKCAGQQSAVHIASTTSLQPATQRRADEFSVRRDFSTTSESKMTTTRTAIGSDIDQIGAAVLRQLGSISRITPVPVAEPPRVPAAPPATNSLSRGGERRPAHPPPAETHETPASKNISLWKRCCIIL